MNIKTIYKLQREYGLAEMQEAINTGMAWKMEGSVGRRAMELLRTGACVLPKVAVVDVYGNRVPSRDDLVSGTLGTFENAVNFWSNDENLMHLEMDNEPDEVALFQHY
jgi:hypothetical protein